jgi:hypothetical protein
MATLVNALSGLFVVISVGVLVYFLHKVAWLVHYKNVQRDMMRDAAERLAKTHAEALPAWDEFAAAAWRVARGPVDENVMDGPVAYARAVEAELQATIDATARPGSVLPLLRAALKSDVPRDETHTVLEVRLRDRSTLRAHLTLNPPTVVQPLPPDDALYELHVASRYGFFRRALVFVTGLADVVYSAHHLAKMSQYTHVPMATIARRLSLVILLVVGIVLEVVLGMRTKLEHLLARRMAGGARWARSLPDLIADDLPAIIAFLAWTLTIAALYFTMYFVVRHKSKRHHVELALLKSQQADRLAKIRNKQLSALLLWATDYGRTLDTAARLTTRHIELFAQHYAARMRRRLAGTLLIDVAKHMRDTFLGQLPEASGTLQDAVTTREHSWRHMLWAQPDEMGHVVAQAQYRDAWQHIELALGELRRGQPAPDEVAAFWRQLVSYALTFDELFDEAMLKRLRSAYVRLVEEASTATEADLERFDQSLNELMRHLDDQMGAATHLLAARVELTNQRIEADTAKLQAKIVRTREAARLEAMAFEI